MEKEVKSMQKNFKQDFEDKYNEIFKNLYVEWKLQSKRKCEELQDNSGIRTKELYKLIEDLINKIIMELQELFRYLPEKYNRKMNLNDLKKYEEKTKNNINGHIDNMEKDIEKIYEGDKLFPGETNKIFLKNVKGNSIVKVEEMCQEIINLRKGKKIEGLVIFDIVFTLLGFVVGVASLIIGIITIGK